MNKRTAKVTDRARKVGDDVAKLGRNFWLVGLGAYSLAEEEARNALDKLISRGEKFEKDEKNVVGKTFDRAAGRARKLGTRVEDTVHDTVTTVLHRAGIPSRDEIRTLIERVEELNRKVEKLQTH